MLHESPEHVHRFYQDVSKLGRPEPDGIIGITTTMAVSSLSLSLSLSLAVALYSCLSIGCPLITSCVPLVSCVHFHIYMCSIFISRIGLYNILFDIVVTMF